jgi:hypothetical protein
VTGAKPSPPPLEANDQLVTAIITAGWVIALAVVLVFRDRLPPPDRWWIWTCVVGVVTGLFGLWYVPRMKRSRTRRAEGFQPWSSDSKTVSSTETPGKSIKS